MEKLPRHSVTLFGALFVCWCSIGPQLALAMHKGSVKKGRREEVQLKSQSLIVYCEVVSALLLWSKIGQQKDMSSTACGRYVLMVDDWNHFWES